jgi:hypothetical protein
MMLLQSRKSVSSLPTHKQGMAGLKNADEKKPLDAAFKGFYNAEVSGQWLLPLTGWRQQG